MKRFLALLLAVVMVLGLVACGAKEEKPAEPAKEETKTEEKKEEKKEEPKEEAKEEEPAAPLYDGPTSYSMIDSFDISTLDYLYNNKSSNGDYLCNFIEGLLTQDNHGTLIEGMAKEWSCNDDGSEWYFTIRDDAVWSTSEGEEYDYVVAEDFVTGLKYAADNDSETIGLVQSLIAGLDDYINGTGTWENVGIKAEGDKLTYTLTGPCGYFDGMTTYSILWPLNAEFLESNNGKIGAVEPSGILYNGCYILSSIVPAQEVRFAKNPNYYDKDNVFVEDVVVTYTDGSDPAQGFNMFVNGETTSTAINSSLPDVVAKADELYAANQYKSMTTSTSYWGAFNFDRQMYTLFNDPSAIMTLKETDQQKEDAKTAILNKYFRLAVYAAFSTADYERVTMGDERALDVARNTLVPYTFKTLSDGTSYGALLTKYVEELEPEFKGIDLNDSQDAWYNPERALKFAEKAKEELGDSVAEWPVHLDYCVLSSATNQVNRALAFAQNVQDAIGEYAVIDINYIEGDADAFYSAYYDIDLGRENSVDITFGAGWGPDYGDPLTYIHCYDMNEGDMLHYSGLDALAEEPLESCEAAKEAIGLADFQKVLDQASAAIGDERIELFAKAEAMLLTSGIARPFSTSGASLAISKVAPFTAAYGLYGQASYNAVPYFKYMKLLEEPVTADEYYAAKEAWLAGE